jgi:hypothetical protein
MLRIGCIVSKHNQTSWCDRMALNFDNSSSLYDSACILELIEWHKMQLPTHAHISHIFVCKSNILGFKEHTLWFNPILPSVVLCKSSHTSGSHFWSKFTGCQLVWVQWDKSPMHTSWRKCLLLIDRQQGTKEAWNLWWADPPRLRNATMESHVCMPNVHHRWTPSSFHT